MSAKEMKLWKKDPCSKAASLKRLEVVNRVTRLLEKPKTLWNSKDYTDSAKVISYLSRASAIKDSVKPASRTCRKGKNYYALKNWAFDRNKVKKNPLIINTLDITKELDNLIGQDVILLVKKPFENYLIHYGTLQLASKKIPNKKLYSFQYNPMNQWKFQKLTKEEKENSNKAPTGDYQGNEIYGASESELAFMHDHPTVQFIFSSDHVKSINTDVGTQFGPKIILNTSAATLHPLKISAKFIKI